RWVIWKTPKSTKEITRTRNGLAQGQPEFGILQIFPSSSSAKPCNSTFRGIGANLGFRAGERSVVLPAPTREEISMGAASDWPDVALHQLRYRNDSDPGALELSP